MSRVPPARLCLLLTARPEFRPPWNILAHVTVLTLRRLAPDQVAQMVTQVAGAKALPAEVVAQIVAKTEGVPLFVEELTKMVLESGLLQEGEAHYTLPGPLPPLAIPATLQDALLARLDRLAAAKGVAQWGATIGRTFAYELLHAVVPLDAATLQGALAQLVAAEVVVQRGHPPQATYLFRHALIQETAYQSLLQSTRRQVHQRIVQVIEARSSTLVETQIDLLAHHALQGELWDKALAYCQQAGEKALARSAYHEAVGYFEQGLSALAHLPETRDTREQAIELRLALRRPLARLREFERALNVLREATTLAETLGDRGRLAYISSYMADYLRLIGDYDRALAAGQRALVLAEALGNVPLETMTWEHLGVIHYYLGDYQRATDMLRRSVGSLKDAPHRQPVGRVDPDAVESRSRLVFCLAEIGAFAEGSTIAAEGIRMAGALNHPLSLARAYCGAGGLYLLKGDLPQALLILERGLAVCDAWNISDWRVPLASRLGYTYALCGCVLEALPLLKQAVEHARHTDSLAYLAAAYLQAGRLSDASTLALRALERSRERCERGTEALVLRLLGDIAMHCNPPEVQQAETHDRQALALADELGMRPLQAHCHRGLGTLYATIGQQEHAHTELSTAITMYQTMEMTFWLPQAEAALAQVEGQRSQGAQQGSP